jgi:hypothetical protein
MGNAFSNEHPVSASARNLTGVAVTFLRFTDPGGP